MKLQTLQTLKTEAEKSGLNGDALTKIVRFESGGDPKAFPKDKDGKPLSKAVGLVQWMPDVFEGMTKPPGYENVRHEDLKDLTAEEQIPLVIQYFKDKKKLPANAGVEDLYLAVAAPGFLGHPDSEVVYPKGSDQWAKNAPWRPTDGGDITVGSIKARARKF